MYLFVNVLLTDTRINHYDRGLLPGSSPVEIFLYSMGSMAPLPFEKVYINLDVADNYKHAWPNIENFLEEAFGERLVLNKSQCETQKQWQERLEPLLEDPDQLIWLLCNHDHVLLDSTDELFHSAVARMQDHKSEHVVFYTSHWPELLPTAFNRKSAESEKFVEFEHETTDSIIILRARTLKYWWWGFNYGSRRLPRTDFCYDGDHVRMDLPQTVIVPKKEFCRHFDGYRTRGICPALRVPPGYFSKNMTISYGTDDNPDSSTNLDPAYPRYRDEAAGGVDFKIMLDEIPMGWRGRVSEVLVGRHRQSEDLLARNDAVWSMATCKGSGFERRDIEYAMRRRPC